MLLPQEPELAAHFVELCDGFLLTGGDDAGLNCCAMTHECVTLTDLTLAGPNRLPQVDVP